MAFRPELARTMTAEEQRQQAEGFLALDPPNLTEARLWLESAAAGGSTEALAAIGWLYEQGLGVEANPQRAMEYYARAYTRGAPEYGLRLGWMFVHGIGVRADRPQGEAWFRRVLREHAYPPANLALASLLLADAAAQMRPEAALEARTLLETALAAGLLEAALELARLHSVGLGPIEVDPPRAIHYARISAEHGNVDMQVWLAYLYARGEVIPQDRVEAHHWAALAAASGNQSGNELRLELEPYLTPAEHLESQRRALLRLYARHPDPTTNTPPDALPQGTETLPPAPAPESNRP
jgi:TPR repeat protein